MSKFDDCRNAVAKFYGEVYENTPTTIGRRGDSLAGHILERHDSRTIAAVFAARREGGTILNWIYAKIAELKPGEGDFEVDLQISILHEVAEECLRR